MTLFGKYWSALLARQTGRKNLWGILAVIPVPNHVGNTPKNNHRTDRAPVSNNYTV